MSSGLFLNQVAANCCCHDLNREDLNVAQMLLCLKPTDAKDSKSMLTEPGQRILKLAEGAS